ncbi:MAG TPA: aldehyde dehydrogenase family protein [Candidatus Cryosericum sp.]|nr:aldehyde dehydrogenase family protein [Candidatus Cryosericum sp.]
MNECSKVPAHGTAECDDVKQSSSGSGFKLTYATMFDSPPELHEGYERALAELKPDFGKRYPMMWGGQDHESPEVFEDRSPTDGTVLGYFPRGTERDAADALAAARAAAPGWAATPWQERVRIMRAAADLLEERVFTLGAILSLEVGKNRDESLGDAAEAVEMIRYACNHMERTNGLTTPMGSDPLRGYKSTNVSVLRPYGVWVVISPFNFPSSLTGGPTGDALVAGNTVVIKPATETPWGPWFIARTLLDAGVPAGAVNFVTGPGSTLGQSLIDSPEVDGLTFTGSYDVGMGIYRSFTHGRWPRPLLLEMGGKNAAIVSRHANLEEAATGIVRSAFGLQGQKCSACSRVLVEKDVYDQLLELIAKKTAQLVIGDPVEAAVDCGPVINRKAQQDYVAYCSELATAGHVLCGGSVRSDPPFDRGWFCMPTVVTDVPFDHPLWKQEMFLPITMVGRVDSLEQAMDIANSVDYGLTAGFYGSTEEVQWFFDHIQAGVVYANRPQGATTGAWPGMQPFGGWKGSGSSGKNSGGVYYLPLYAHEQIQTTIEKLT